MTENSKVFVNLNLASLCDSGPKYGWIEDAAVVVVDGLIDWLGSREALPSLYNSFPQIDLGGRVVTPGLIDCHTHIVHGGNRAVEFEMRLNGASYEEVARAGGGIVSTVKATRAATDEELLTTALARVDVLIAEGVTCIEIKSGYGLDIETELRMLRVALSLIHI